MSAVSVTDTITGAPTVGNCNEGQRTYSPVCGRYSLWNGTGVYYSQALCNCSPLIENIGHATVSTRCNRYGCERHRHCSHWNGLGFCVHYNRHHNNCYNPCYTCQSSTVPEPYLHDATRTKSHFTNSTLWLVHNYGSNPQGSTTSCSLSYQPLLNKFWFSARDAAGLQYRFHNQMFPGSTALGTDYAWATIIDPAADVYNDGYDQRKIYSDQFDSAPVAYLQYRFHGSTEFNTITGGYVLRLLHTKCRRVGGNYLTDSLQNRGAVEYLILDAGEDPNTDRSLESGAQTLQFVNGVTNMNSGSETGYMWLKVKNNLADYPDSTGTYSIRISTTVNYGSFTIGILNPLFNIFRDKVNDLALGTFQKITCYQMNPSDSCINFFNYLKALLILYIMFLGFRFIIGANIKHEELMKSLIKIVIVIGLMNGGTFEFFRDNIYPLVTGFSDQIIANMSGFSMISSTNNIENPFMFLDALMSKMLMNPTFLFQLLTTMAMGITGVFYFLIICVSVIVFIVSIFRAMAVYIMALLATSLLIGVAPLFISFILFERTYYLFENWAKFTFRYMMEPVIVMAGIIILTQLFSLYIDQVLSFSLCWKCALPFKIPFASLLPLPGLQNIPLFCIYWFSPWGLDPVNDPMGMDLSMVIGLAMVAYSAYGYVEFAGKIATRLVGGGGGPSSISLGSAMNKDFGNKVKDAALLAQDEMAKKLGGNKGGDQSKGEGSGEGDSGSDPRRGSPSMGGPAGEGGDGDSLGDSGALKSGTSGAKLDLGGASTGESSSDDVGASTSDAAGTSSADRVGTESAASAASSAAAGAVTGDAQDGPVTPEDQKAEAVQQEKEADVAAKSDEQTETRLTEISAERSNTGSSGESGQDLQGESSANMSHEQVDEVLDDTFSGDPEVKAMIPQMDSVLKAKLLANPGSSEAMESLQTFLSRFKGESREGIATEIIDKIMQKGKGSMND